MSSKTIVTCRNTITNEQLYIQCQSVSEALQTAGKLNQIELYEHTYKQVRLRSSRPNLKQGYRWVNLVKWIYNNGA
jgi:hypothetical protein